MVSYPLWIDWYKVAEPVNDVAGWLTMLLAGILWILNPLRGGGYNASALIIYLPVLICGILAGIFYMLSVKKDVETRNLTSELHIWLWICFIVSCFAGFAGIAIWTQFIMVGILSDVPFWKAF